MQPTQVVPALNPGKDGQAGLDLRLPDASVDQLTLQRGKEALSHGVVIGVARRSHGDLHPQLPAPVAKLYAGVLATLIRVMDHALCLAGGHRHLQRLSH